VIRDELLVAAFRCLVVSVSGGQVLYCELVISLLKCTGRANSAHARRVEENNKFCLGSWNLSLGLAPTRCKLQW